VPPPEHWVPLAALRQAVAGAPVVILTDRSPALFADYAARSIAGILGKPFDLDELTSLVRRLLPAGIP
jgi:DNA-binding response OmpR family regulator